MIVYAIASKGLGKLECEDSVLIGNNIISEGYMEWNAEERFTVAVADGVGGNKAGAEASYRAVRGIKEGKVFQGCSIEYLDSLLTNINQSLVNASLHNSDFEKMATTMSGLYYDKKKVLLYHVGNTRVYSLNGHYLKQLTVDHTNVNYWISMGVMSKLEAEQHERRNEIYACLGGGDTKLADKRIVKEVTDVVKTNCHFLLTTDGVHDYISIDDMEEIMNMDISIKSKLEYLANKSRENGSQDDISIIYVSCNKPDYQ